MAGTCRSSPPPTAGRSGHPTCGQAASTTPPRYAYIPKSLPALAAWTAQDRPAPGDPGDPGEADTITVAFKKPKGGELTDQQKTHNKTHNGKRAIGERGNPLLKTTFKALRNISLCPWKIDTIAAALVILHIEHNRTT